MKKALSRWLLRISGWNIGPLGEYVPKCVVCVAPHTSNWDFIIGKLFYTAIGRDAGFLIKKEWFVFPFNFLFDWMGGVPVDRNKHASVTDQMVQEFAKREVFHLAITPEGSREPTDQWKKGFYYIASKAKVPILVAYFDYGKKEVGVKTLFYPTGDADADIQTIRTYFLDVTGCHPGKFVQL